MSGVLLCDNINCYWSKVGRRQPERGPRASFILGTNSPGPRIGQTDEEHIRELAQKAGWTSGRALGRMMDFCPECTANMEKPKK